MCENRQKINSFLTASWHFLLVLPDLYQWLLKYCQKCKWWSTDHVDHHSPNFLREHFTAWGQGMSVLYSKISPSKGPISRWWVLRGNRPPSQFQWKYGRECSLKTRTSTLNTSTKQRRTFFTYKHSSEVSE